VEKNGTTSEDADRLRRRHFAGIHWRTNRIVAHSISNKSDNFIFSKAAHGSSDGAAAERSRSSKSETRQRRRHGRARPSFDLRLPTQSRAKPTAILSVTTPAALCANQKR
jgi:hypothetical protein